METLIEVCSRHYMIFFCEGRNEEDALRWIIESNRLSLDHEFCNFEYLRKLRTKNKRKDILTRILRDDYGREPALIYLLDSLKEKITLPSEFNQTPIYYVYTVPEFEILFIIHMNQLKEYNQLNPKPKASEFVKSKLGRDIKSEGSVKRIFDDDIDNLIEASRILKATYKNKKDLKKQYGLYDLCIVD